MSAMLAAATGFTQAHLAYIYGHDAYQREQEKKYRPDIQLLGDSALIISSAILMNVAPEKYTITFGLTQTAPDPARSLKLINERITRFTGNLKKNGFTEADMYVDFISQNRVYDFSLINGEAIEKEKGFEIKKNITIIFGSETQAEFITQTAAEQQIFDVIKIEYLLSDYTVFYKQLFAEAVQQIKNRKEMYLAATGMELLPRSALHTDELTVIFPRTQYKKYTAFETGEVEGNYRNLVKKELRKSFTAYYEGISQHSFDKIFNNNKPGVFIQLALGVSLKYYIKKTG
jgi:uncharacterized protein YggE